MRNKSKDEILQGIIKKAKNTTDSFALWTLQLDFAELLPDNFPHESIKDLWGIYTGFEWDDVMDDYIAKGWYNPAQRIYTPEYFND